MLPQAPLKFSLWKKVNKTCPGWYHIKFKPTVISETCLLLHHLGSDITGHPAHLDYISTPGKGLWQDTSQQASWMESTDHCTSPWFKLDTSIVHLSKLIMGCYVNLTWSPPPYLVCLGWVSSHTKSLMMKTGPVSGTQIDLNNLMWMSACVDFTEHS